MAELFVYLLPAGWREFFVALFIIQFILIVVGNLTIIVTFLWERTLLTAINIYIFSLSCADIMLSTSAAVYARIMLLDGDHFYKNRNNCKILYVLFFVYLNFLSGVFTMIAIAVDRYRAIVQPQKTKFSRRHSIIAVCIIWAVSTLLSASQHIADATAPRAEHNQTCQIDDTYLESLLANSTVRECYDPWIYVKPYNSEHVIYCTAIVKEEALIFTGVFIVVVYILPLVIIGGLYSRIICELYSTASSFSITLPEKSINRKKRAIRMLIIIVILFSTAYLPMHIIHVVRIAKLGNWDASQDLTIGVLLNFSYILIMCNTWLNVIVYSFYNTKFRDVVKRMVPGVSCISHFTARDKSKESESSSSSASTKKTKVTISCDRNKKKKEAPEPQTEEGIHELNVLPSSAPAVPTEDASENVLKGRQGVSQQQTCESNI